jgi:hypothetical protein
VKSFGDYGWFEFLSWFFFASFAPFAVKYFGFVLCGEIWIKRIGDSAGNTPTLG